VSNQVLLETVAAILILTFEFTTGKYQIRNLSSARLLRKSAILPVYSGLTQPTSSKVTVIRFDNCHYYAVPRLNGHQHIIRRLTFRQHLSTATRARIIAIQFYTVLGRLASIAASALSQRFDGSQYQPDQPVFCRAKSQLLAHGPTINFARDVRAVSPINTRTSIPWHILPVSRLCSQHSVHTVLRWKFWTDGGEGHLRALLFSMGADSSRVCVVCLLDTSAICADSLLPIDTTRRLCALKYRTQACLLSLYRGNSWVQQVTWV